MYLHHETNQMMTCGEWITKHSEQWFIDAVDNQELSRMIYDPDCDQWFELIS